MLLAALLSLSLLSGPAEALRASLDAGQAVSVVVIGDSIGDGMHLPDPDAEGYPALFVNLLSRRFPTATVTLHNLSVAGQATHDALAAFDTAVPPLKPGVVVIQLGGNDKGTGDGLEQLPGYRAFLKELITKSLQLGALPVILAPPMHEPVTGMPFPEAAMQVAAENQVPAVDADRVIKALGADYRGLFVYFMHPREREHAALAIALDQAVAESLGVAAGCEVQIAERVSEARQGEGVEVVVELRNPGDQAVDVRLSADDLTFEPPSLRLPAGDKQAATGRFALPHTQAAGRSAEWPLLVCAEVEGRLAFAAARLTAVPIVRVPEPAALVAPLVELSEMHRVVGRGRYHGPRDLSARVFGQVDEQTLTLTVTVRDDLVVGGEPPLSDGLELYFDLRGDVDRGRAYFTRQVALLLVPPQEDRAVLALIEDQPPPELLAVPTTREPTPDGYRVTFAIPRASLDAAAGRRVTEFGFDLAVDDDDGQGRKTQLLWFGRTDNFVNPRRFGQLRLAGEEADGRVRVTIFP